MLLHTNRLGYRGVPVALYDYAVFFEELAGGTSYISSFASIDPTGRDNFEERFPGRQFFLQEPQATAEMNALTARLGVDAVFTIQSGESNPFERPPTAKLLILAVFNAVNRIGDGYAALSESIQRGPGISILPHIVYMNESYASLPSLRVELGIPPTARVFCRHGGFLTMDFEFVRAAMCQYAQERNDTYFLLLGTDTRPCEARAPNIIHLAATTDRQYKRRFLNTCNACLHARQTGRDIWPRGGGVLDGGPPCDDPRACAYGRQKPPESAGLRGEAVPRRVEPAPHVEHI